MGTGTRGRGRFTTETRRHGGEEDREEKKTREGEREREREGVGRERVPLHWSRMSGRGRRIGLGAGAVAVAILLGLGFALRGKIAEEWYLYRLRTGDARVKEHAAGMLHALSSPRTPYLIYRLRLGEERHFSSCVAGLSRAGAEAVGPLVEIVREVSVDHNIRRHAAEALGKIGRPAWGSAPALLEYLGEVGFEPGLGWREVDSRSIDPRKSIWHYRSTCTTVITALGGMDPEDSEVVEILAASVTGFARQPAVQALAGMAPRAKESVPALGRALEVPSLDNRLEADFRFTVTQSLVRFGPDAAPAMASLRQALQDQWRKVRSGAAEALGAIGPGAAEAVPDLEALLADRDESVRGGSGGAGEDTRLSLPSLPSAHSLSRSPSPSRFLSSSPSLPFSPLPFFSCFPYFLLSLFCLSAFLPSLFLHHRRWRGQDREGEREREREGVQNDIDPSSATFFTKASSVIFSCTSWRSLARTLTVPSSASLAPTTTM